MKTAPLYHKIRGCTKKFIVMQGGTGGAKTVSTLQLLATYCIEQPGIIVTVVGQDVPNLKKGAIRDFHMHVESDPEIKAHIQDYNKSDRIYTFYNGSIIEFNSYTTEQDSKAGRRHYLFVNEANGIPWAIFWQLQRRTKKQVFIDYNPTAPFWAHEKLLKKDEQGVEIIDKEFAGKVQYYRVFHQHNPFLTAEEHESIENISDPELFRVYARGLTGKVAGLIFAHFKKCKLIDIPTEKNGTRRHDGTTVTNGYDRIMWGIDYGYTNDPTAIMKITVVGRKRYHQELSYEPGTSAQRIKEIMELNGYESGQAVYTDSDPNMVNQLRMIRIPAAPAIKGPGSEIASISKTKEYECYATECSVNFWAEIMSWKWVTAEDLATGKTVLTNQPMKGGDHCCDGSRYAIYTDSFRHRSAA